MRLLALLAFLPFMYAQELIAEVRNIPDKCGLDNTIQYWINTASAARESTLQIIGGDFKLKNLEVSGTATLADTSFTTVNFDQLVERVHSGEGAVIHSTFNKQVHMDGGIRLTCSGPKPCLIVSENQEQPSTLKLQNIELQIGNVAVGETLKTLSDKISVLEQKVATLEADVTTLQNRI